MNSAAKAMPICSAGGANISGREMSNPRREDVAEIGRRDRGCAGHGLSVGPDETGSIEEVANWLLKEHRAGKGDLSGAA